MRALREQPAGEPATPVRPGRRVTGRRGLLSLLAVAVLLTLGLVLGPGLPGSSAEVVRIEATSMSPTLVSGDRVLMSAIPRDSGAWSVGDVVVIDRGSGALLAKRVVGVGGDVVSIRDGRLWRNGEPVREPWSDPGRIDSVYFGPVRVPAGTVFVLGDNRRVSRDSREFGPVPVSEVRALVLAVVWPPSHVGGVR